ncbi:MULTISPECIES: PASTA domain-containing protein [unclassified Kaistella]|uniref:PASTA domain-containing protein n=1 Tax=unclassified Kaistella TaxID=2762626 RepID=UPI002733A081|nr:MULTISPECIES: PASTA domain-containing protein [unclassified Kaistella]MDP2452550.1 PASTA domain-containing protein [Kaistella sp. SH11-4b]MDP2455458.1 PASTA domain-containing protein [Kaistella sp. SH40-3]MDP2458362.1 PASTA domain-containing protein [Kaistella sp. SH19-2b]
MLKSLFHWKVWVNILLASAVFAGAVWLTFRWLELHTNHGKEIAVPNVMNKSVHEAIKVLEDTGLDYEVDSGKYEPKFKPFQVLQIYPSPGSRVKDGRTIILKVNPRSYAPVSVPDVLDRYKGLAFRQLEQVGLKIGDTILEPSIQRDAVLRLLYNGATLKPGALLPRFSTIDIVIGAGPKRNISVPNLVGLTVQEAKAVIKQNLFEIGLVEHEDGGADESDIVYYQDPAAFDVRDQGMQIDIWASKKTPAEMGGKISQLNSIYRIKMDYSVPENYDNETPVYREPVPRGSESEVVEAPKSTVPKSETPKQEVKKVETSKGTEQKPKPAEGKPTTPAKTTPTKTEEKPKVKKVIVE